MTIQSTMYSVYFETRVCLHGKLIGRTMELSDPDVFPAINDQEAIKKAFERAELIEYLKSLKIRNTKIDKKLLVRVKKVVRKDKSDEIVIAPKYTNKKGFKKIA